MARYFEVEVMVRGYHQIWDAPVGILGAVLFVLLHTSVPHFRLTVFRTITFQIQFAVYSFTFLVVFLISGPLLIIGIEYEAPRKAKQAKAQVEGCSAKV